MPIPLCYLCTSPVNHRVTQGDAPRCARCLFDDDDEPVDKLVDPPAARGWADDDFTDPGITPLVAGLEMCKTCYVFHSVPCKCTEKWHSCAVGHPHLGPPVCNLKNCTRCKKV